MRFSSEHHFRVVECGDREFDFYYSPEAKFQTLCYTLFSGKILAVGVFGTSCCGDRARWAIRLTIDQLKRNGPAGGPDVQLTRCGFSVTYFATAAVKATRRRCFPHSRYFTGSSELSILMVASVIVTAH
jgi:hypothetical protein